MCPIARNSVFIGAGHTAVEERPPGRSSSFSAREKKLAKLLPDAEKVAVKKTAAKKTEKVVAAEKKTPVKKSAKQKEKK